MIIFGTTGISSVQTRGNFHCPACGPGAAYEQKKVTRFFTLFFIPLIPLGRVASYIICARCGGNFKPEVLTWGGRVPTSPDGSPPPLPGANPPPVFASHHGGHLPTTLPGGMASTITYQSNGLATASMILGILGLLSSFLLCPSIFFCVIGLILGILGLSRFKKGAGLVDGKNMAIAGIACSSLGLAIILVLGIMVAKDRKPGQDTDSDSPRRAAAMSISPTSKKTAYGNTPKAIELAEKYASMMSGMHQLAFKSSKDKDKAPKDAKYVVHCEIHESTCAFLVCVPEYRRFTDDAKTSLEELAWSTGAAVLKEEPDIDPESELCVALKGIVMFGSVMTGPMKADSPVANTKRAEDMDRFFPSEEIKEPTPEEVE